jgi:putative ABC transport system permease protein
MYLHRMLKITLRNFRSNITSTLIKILGLAISIAAVLIIWSYVINENKYDSGIRGSNRVFRLEAQWASMPPFIGHVLNQNLGNQIVATRLNFWTDVGIQIDNIPFNLQDLVFADSTFFRVIPLEFIAGNPDEALTLPYTLVLSESVAQKLFGTTDAIGKIVRFENQFDFTVTGIIKDYPFLHLKIEVVASIVSLEKIRSPGILQAYDGWSYPTYLLLPDGASKTDYETRINELLAKFRYDKNFRLKPFDEIYYSPEVENESNTKHGNILYNRILIAVSVFILLLAAINFINLTIANAVSRSKEVSLKKIQGASRVQLIIQFMFETVLFIILSIGLAFIFLWFFNPVLETLTGFSVDPAEFCTRNNILVLFNGLFIFILLTGIYPSLYISSYTINTAKSVSLGSSGHLGIRNGLIIFQNLVSITLICCTLIANRQFQYMNKKDLGFNKDNVVILKINSQMREHMDLFKERLLSNPEITSVSYSSRIPGNYWGSWCCVNIEGKENKYFNNYVDPDYLKTMEIKLKEGRNFSSDNPADKKATYLINETAIKLYDLKNPIGQVIVPGNGVKGRIIGIINDFHYRGLNYEQTPLILFYTPEYKNYVNIKLNGGNTEGALGKIRMTWEEICPAFSFEYKFLDVTYDLQYQTERKFESLLFSFAMLALFIASIGLFGLSVFSIERRTKEIGIRKVNGATTLEIMGMLNSDIIKWVIIAFIAACPVAWYSMNKWLQDFAYRTDITWWIFALSGLIALGIALLTVSWLSWKAATRNPVEALRYE